MAVKYFVRAAISEYLDTKTNTMKKKHQSIGVVLETKKGELMLVLESLPLFALKEGKLVAFLNDFEATQQPKEDSVPDDKIPF